ncbi:MAG: NAD-dependent epimerase/dehydratase family protein [Burkholderiaceae bacterium]|nr:NAD-dependent epimerase/dehydratase family protein [Burkholderiaceae bacterium]
MSGHDAVAVAPPAGSVALVTGGAGFIGSHLCIRLAAVGVAVHSASRRAQASIDRVQHWSVDLSDALAVEQLVDRIRPDYVFHLAGHVQGAPDLKHLLPAFRSNLQTTVNLLTAVAERGCRRFVMTGSFMEPAGTSADSTPTSPYAAAKWASSAYVRMFHRIYGVPTTTARVFMVYGPGQHDLTKLVPYTICTLLNGEAPKITSGRRLVDWIHAEDVADGFARLAVAEGALGKTVDLGSGSLISTLDLVTTICRLVSPTILPEVGALPDRPMEPTAVAQVDQTFADIGWSPRIGLEEGLRGTIDHYRRQPGF